MVGVQSKSVSLFAYFALWCLYSLQGVLYTSGGMISRGLLLIIMLWSVGIMFKVNTSVSRLPNFLHVVNCFIAITTLYGLILIASGEELFVLHYTKISNFEYLKNIYMSLLPIYVFYFYSLKREMKMNHLPVFIIILFCINILNYFNEQAQSLMLAIQNQTSTEGFTLNVGYQFLALLPLILVYNKRPLLQYIFTLTSLCFIILCMKRGAILIGVLCFILFLFTMLKCSNRNHRYIVLLLSFASLAVGVYFIVDLLHTNDYFLQRIEQTIDGDSSSRNKLYSTFFNHFISEQNFFRFIFGNGANATLKVGVNYAHNDWLELAINNGLVGLVLYVCYFIALFKDYRYLKKYNQLLANVILMTLMVLFMSSLFSMSYNSIDRAIAIALGFVLAQAYPNKNLCV